MLSKAADALPGGDGWQFEPKWDGFRTLVFRDGDEIVLQSRDEKPMNRYFPELIAPLAAALPQRCVLDGEIVIAGARGLDFEALLLRIHPAASRVKLLAAESPASFVVWDLLASGDDDLREAPLSERREPHERGLTAGAASGPRSPAARCRPPAQRTLWRRPGARPRSRLRSHAGIALPPRRALCPLALRQGAARLPLRSVGGHARLRAGARLRRAPPRVVIGIGRLLRRPLRFRHVAQVHADARP